MKRVHLDNGVELDLCNSADCVRVSFYLPVCRTMFLLPGKEYGLGQSAKA